MAEVTPAVWREQRSWGGQDDSCQEARGWWEEKR